MIAPGQRIATSGSRREQGPGEDRPVRTWGRREARTGKSQELERVVFWSRCSSRFVFVFLALGFEPLRQGQPELIEEPESLLEPLDDGTGCSFDSHESSIFVRNLMVRA